MKKVLIMILLIVAVMTATSVYGEYRQFEYNRIRYMVHNENGDTVSICGWNPIENGVRVNLPNPLILDSICFDPEGRKYVVTSIVGRIGGGGGLTRIDNVTTMILPKTIRRIGYGIIYTGYPYTWFGRISRNDSLKKIEMPGVEVIDKYGMRDNPTLATPLDLRNLVSLGEEALGWCSLLPEVRFGESLRFIGRNAFQRCNGLKTVEIADPDKWSRVRFEDASANPIAMTHVFNVYGKEVGHLDIDMGQASVSQWAFAGAANLRSVRIRNAKRVDSRAFDSCDNLADLCLDVEMLCDEAFSNNRSLRRVYVLSNRPPRAYRNVFSNYDNITLYVPQGSLSAYRNTEYCWSLFQDIRESDFSEVDDLFRADYEKGPSSLNGIERDNGDGDDGDIDFNRPVEVYNMQGHLLSRTTEGLRPGLYILRQGRKSRKVIIGRP